MLTDRFSEFLRGSASPADKAAAAVEALHADGDAAAAVIMAHLPQLIPSEACAGERAAPFLSLIAFAAQGNRAKLAAMLAILLRERVAPLRPDGPAAEVMGAARLAHFDDPWDVAKVGRAAFLNGLGALYERASGHFIAAAPYWRDPKTGPDIVRTLILNRQPRIEAAERRFVYNQSNLPRGYAEAGVHPNLAIDVLTLRDLDFEAIKARIARPQTIINNIGSPEMFEGTEFGHLIERIAAEFDLPVINAPEKLRAVSRSGNYERIGETEHLIFPKTRPVAAGADPTAAAAALAKEMTFPLIIRDQVSHMGAAMHLASTEAEVAEALRALGGAAAYAIEYHDYPQADGLYYRYRIYRVRDQVTPSRIHCATSWNVHGKEHDSLKKTRPELGLAALEVQFWERPLELIPEPVWRALTQVLNDTGLDFVGCDFTMTPEGRAFIFEVNPSMHMKLKGREGFERLVGVA